MFGITFRKETEEVCGLLPFIVNDEITFLRHKEIPLLILRHGLIFNLLHIQDHMDLLFCLLRKYWFLHRFLHLYLFRPLGFLPDRHEKQCDQARGCQGEKEKKAGYILFHRNLLFLL